MSFWLRELAGWLLLALSLCMIAMTYVFCERRWIFELWPWTILSIFVFRGSIHLLKVALAARICQQVQDRLYPADDPSRRSVTSRPGGIIAPRSSAGRGTLR